MASRPALSPHFADTYARADTTVAGIALPAIGRNFGASLTTLQWVVSAYTLTLAGLLLFAGTLGDRYGRKRVFLTGVIWFALSSLICGLAPDAPVQGGAVEFRWSR